MKNATIRPVEKPDLPLLDQALRALSQDLGDAHLGDVALLERTGFGATPAYHALIAESGQALLGAVVFSPILSTVRGMSGLYVSDLWVGSDARGMGLGPRLLAAATRVAADRWCAEFLNLAVYHTSVGARRFYDRLGFAPRSEETKMVLDTSGFEALKGLR